MSAHTEVPAPIATVLVYTAARLLRKTRRAAAIYGQSCCA